MILLDVNNVTIHWTILLGRMHFIHIPSNAKANIFDNANFIEVLWSFKSDSFEYIRLQEFHIHKNILHLLLIVILGLPLHRLMAHMRSRRQRTDKRLRMAMYCHGTRGTQRRWLRRLEQQQVVHYMRMGTAIGAWQRPWQRLQRKRWQSVRKIIMHSMVCN